MPRKGENIYKRKDGRWEGRYIKNRSGKKAIYGYVYAKSYSEVRKKLNLKRAQYVSGEEKLFNAMQKDASFSTISDLWLLSMKSSVKESTWIKYRNTLNCQINHLTSYLYLCTSLFVPNIPNTPDESCNSPTILIASADLSDLSIDSTQAYKLPPYEFYVQKVPLR